MKNSRKYFVAVAIAILAGVALLLWYKTESTPTVPVRTSPAALAELANYTRISVQGDFELEVSQLQDYSIDYLPLNARQGDLQARVENDTLIITGFGNRTAVDTAVLRIGVPVLDTLEVNDVPRASVSNFTAPLMNIRLAGVDAFTFQNNVLGSLNLEGRGGGVVNLRGNTLTTRNIQVEDPGVINIIPD